ncbi:unnamed protein product [Diamesa serratosioi]
MTELCRLCAKQKCFIDMVMEVHDVFMETKLSCKDIVQKYCHVNLDYNKLLPQSVCDECKGTIEHFVSFCQIVEQVQIKLQNENEMKPEYKMKDCFVELQSVDTVENTSGIVLNSSPDDNFFEMNQYELDSDFDEQFQNGNSEAEPQSKLKVPKRLRDVLKPETIEEIFENELNGSSQFPILRYTIPQSEVLENGAITDNGQKLFSSLRWNTIMNKCEIVNCGKTGFDSLLSLRFHHEIDHDSKEVIVPCPLCTKSSYKTIYGFINHICNKHLLDHLKFCCIVCSTMFNDLLSLLKHIKTIHSNTRNISQCLICGHHSDQMGDLKQHKLSHKITENDNYMDIFQSELNINIQDSKYNLKLLECYKHPNGAVTDDAQTRYKKWQHFNFTCNLCPMSDEKSFNFMDYYLHCSTEHGDEKQQPKYYCTDCPDDNSTQIFSHMQTLVTHQITCHNKELSYCCLVCSKMFWNYAALDTHYKHYHQCFKAFFCLICGRHYPHRSAKVKLVNHAVIEHKLKRNKQQKIALIVQLDVKEIHHGELKNEIKHELSEELSINSEQESFIKKKRSRAHCPQQQQMLYSDTELNTVEKLFELEITGTSAAFPGKLHLNVSQCDVLTNGELTHDGEQQLDVMRWKDLLCCAKCKFNCDSIVKLKDHIVVNHTQRFHALICYECNDCSYHNETPWLNHIVSKHYDHLKFCCLVCSQMLYDFQSLLSHYNNYHKDHNYNIYPCLICGFYSKTLIDLKQHKASHMSVEKTANMIITEEHYKSFSKKMDASLFCVAVPQEDRLFDGSVSKVFVSKEKLNVNWNYLAMDCTECSFVAKANANPYELIKHYRNKHPNLRRSAPALKTVFKCKLCKDKDYNNIVTLISHGMHKHDTSYTDTSIYTCIVCTKMFWNFVSIHNHYRDCHSTFKVSVCLYCGRIFDSITSLASHVRGHKLTIDCTTNDYKCATCCVCFNTVELFKIHQCAIKGKSVTSNNNNNNTSQICPTCGKSFMNRGTLSTHIKIHAPPEQPKTCEICLKVYPNKYKLKQHSITHNPHFRPFNCNVCGMTFKMKNLLKRHTMVHTGERPFPCTSCERRFSTPYDLRVHARLHTGDFPYECVHCDARYPAWSNLYKHTKSKHNLDIRSAGYKQLIASRAQPNDDNN